MYTGYFAKLKKYKDAGLTPVAISRTQPAFYRTAPRKIQCFSMVILIGTKSTKFNKIMGKA